MISNSQGTAGFPATTTGCQGHAPGKAVLVSRSALEHLGWRVRRVGHAGRGWPLSVKVGRGVRVTGSGTVRLGPEVRLNDGVWLHVEDGAHINIGAGCAIGRNSMITSARSITLGQRVLLGPDVLVTDNGHGRPGTPISYIDQPLTMGGPIVVGDHAWLARGATLISGSQGVSVGRGAIVAANVIVRSDVEPHTIAH